MDNMTIYNAVKTVPQEAQRTIQSGRLKDFTDINPMWRIKTLTEQFGMCGFGWYFDIDREWLEPANTSGETACFVEISLYIKVDGEWSKPIKGIGGNKFLTQETKRMYMSDECYKMALTDALSVACKSLGIGADIYWSADATKYTTKVEPAPAPAPVAPLCRCPDCGKEYTPTRSKSGRIFTSEDIFKVRQSKNTDGVGRCTECATAKGTVIVDDN